MEKTEDKDARDRLYTIIEVATLFFVRNLDAEHSAAKYLNGILIYIRFYLWGKNRLFVAEKN